MTRAACRLLPRGWRATLAAGFMVALSLPGRAQPDAAASTDRSEHVTSGGLQRTYELHVPAGPASDGGFPVILAFHGGGSRGDAMARLTHLSRLADARRFIAVYPDGVDRHWNDGRSTIKHPVDDIGFVTALLQQLQRDQQINPGRIYATGISNGALFAERLGCEAAGRIAAIAPVAGTLPADLAPSCRPLRRIGVLQIDGTADPIMPYEGGAVSDFGGRGEGGHVLSVRDTLAFWAGHNGCGAPGSQVPLEPQRLLDRTRVLRTAFSGCAADGPVTLLTVEGGGHAWPGGAQYAPAFIIGRASRQLDATVTIVDFFLSLAPRA